MSQKKLNKRKRKAEKKLLDALIVKLKSDKTLLPLEMDLMNWLLWINF